jgi:S1-C subfamily serine protease
MYRLSLPCCVALLALTAAPTPAETPSSKEALALQEALQTAIQEAEPAIACILVSHSTAYAGVRQGPLGDGKLGLFDLDKARTALQMARNDPRMEDLKKLDLADPANVPEAYGSGIVIDDSGLVLTNYHVIRDATKIFVRLPGDKESYADIHAADPRSDLAVLRLLTPPSSLKAIKVGDGGKVRKGQMVLSIANPFAAGFRDGSPSASWGIISNLRRRAPSVTKEEERKKTLHHYGTLLQTDARLNLGCSGGALIDLKGELIGLTTALAAISGSETAGGFAVPLDAPMKRIIEVLRRGEEVEYGFLGVEPEPQRKGVVLRDVTPWSPAFRAGLRARDSLLSINGTPLADYEDLFLAVNTAFAGTDARIEVQAPDQSVRTVTVSLAKYYIPGPIIASRKPPVVRGLRVDYLSVLMQMTPTVMPNQPSVGGVMVREVQANSPAATATLRVQEVITHVNGKPVHTPAEFYREAQKATGALELTIEHPDKRQVSIKN